MGMIRSNLDGTMAPAFSIGKRGPTLHQGISDPNTSNHAGTNGDLYVQVGTTPKLYQFRATQWVVFEGSGSYKQTITASDLSNGVVVIQHNLMEDFPSVEVYDNTRRKIIPDEIVSVDANSISISLNSYGNIVGNWSISIRK